MAYVWYSNEDNPTKESFRNLNLELVYNGFSGFNAPSDDMKEDFYDAFPMLIPSLKSIRRTDSRMRKILTTITIPLKSYL